VLPQAGQPGGTDVLGGDADKYPGLFEHRLETVHNGSSKVGGRFGVLLYGPSRPLTAAPVPGRGNAHRGSPYRTVSHRFFLLCVWMFRTKLKTDYKVTSRTGIAQWHGSNQGNRRGG